MKKITTLKNILNIILIGILCLLLVLSFYIKIEFANETVEEFYFYLTTGIGGTDLGVIVSFLKKCSIPLILLFIIVISLMYNSYFNIVIVFSKKNKKHIKIINKDKLNKLKDYKKICPIGLLSKHRIISTTIFSVLVVIILMFNLKIFETINDNIQTTTFIEDNIVLPNKDMFSFDSDKHNLITIYVESLETTFFTKDQGGYWDYEVIPELYNILNDKDTVAFSRGDKQNGMRMFPKATFTTSSIVANSTALPFIVPIDGNKYNSKNFMSGAYSIGELLKEHGYYNEVISGAKTSFGGLKQFFDKHGNYNIIDPDTMGAYDYHINKHTKGAWGFNDKYIFEIARDRIKKLASEYSSFNETIITIDTHHMDGFKGEYTLNKYDTQYENVYATTSKLIHDFVSWVKEQDFYKETTIVIIGDHPSMQTDFFKDINYLERNRYYAIINSKTKTQNIKNRDYSPVDTFPTVVNAIGGHIKGDRIGLGTNLFSDEKTIYEKLGFDYVVEELKKKSIYYNNNILGADYYNMVLTDYKKDDE